jgi:phage head maturation protease
LASVVSSPNPAGPLLAAGAITTLVGATSAELAATAAALAVGYRAGLAIVPGWQVAGPGEVELVAYESSWLDWRSLVQYVADEAGIVPPWIDIELRRAPLEARRPRPVRDPAADAFWRKAWAEDDAQDEAEAAGREYIPRPVVMYIGASGAGEGWMCEQYRSLKGKTALVLTAHSAFTEASWGDGEEWAGSFGRVIRFADICGQERGVSAYLDRIVDRIADDPAPDPPVAAPPKVAYGDVAAFFTAQGAGGVEAMREITTDSQSEESRRLKAQAKEWGITSGQLWHHAECFRRTLEVAEGGSAVLYGYAAVTDQWRVANSELEGYFMERLAHGCFGRTLAESGRDAVKATFRHGYDGRLVHKALGRITLLEEDAVGLRYEVETSDADEVQALVPWLATGAYGSSISNDPRADDLVLHPGPSAHNPHALPERTIHSLRVQELGPTPTPAYTGTSAGLRAVSRSAPPTRKDHRGLQRLPSARRR